jgi:DnaJ-class molecular chaperone
LDIDRLYEKYTSVKNNEKEIHQQDSNNSIVKDIKSSNLDTILICPMCNGLGLRKDIYNHIVREYTCDKCDGDGILQKELQPLLTSNKK